MHRPGKMTTLLLHRMLAASPRNCYRLALRLPLCHPSPPSIRRNTAVHTCPRLLHRVVLTHSHARKPPPLFVSCSRQYVTTASSFPPGPPSSSSLFDSRSSFLPSLTARPYVVWLIIGANVLVFLLWRSSGGSYRDQRWMIDNFTVSLRSLSAGRLHTLVTAAFSQQDVTHLLLNCLALYVFGTQLCMILGTGRFLLVYFGGAVTSSMAHVVYQNYIYPRLLRSKQARQRQSQPYNPYYNTIAASTPYAFDRPAMGASGSAMSCTVLFACLSPYSQLLLYGIIPVPAWAAATGLIALDAYSAWRASESDHTAHFGHLGGAAFGIAYYLLALRRRRGGGGSGMSGWRSGQQTQQHFQSNIGWRGRMMAVTSSAHSQRISLNRESPPYSRRCS